MGYRFHCVRRIKEIAKIQKVRLSIILCEPFSIENAKKIFKDSITYTTSIDEAIKDADICFIMTEWKQILNYDISNYKNKMKRPLVFDGRNCYTLDTMKDLGIEYYSIGR